MFQYFTNTAFNIPYKAWLTRGSTHNQQQWGKSTEKVKELKWASYKMMCKQKTKSKGRGREREKGARERQELALQMYYTDALPSALHRVPSPLPPPPLSHSLLLCTSHSSRRRRVTFAACLVCRALWNAVCASECAASWVCVCVCEWVTERVCERVWVLQFCEWNVN